MRCILRLVAIATTITFVACGGGSRRQNALSVNGSWYESLTDSSGQQLGSFTFDLTQNGTALTTTNLSFANAGSLTSCFGSGTVMGGQMGIGMMSGGTMSMTMSWTNNGETNTLTMQGNMGTGMGSSSGTFSLTAQTAGCMSDTGTFTMAHT